MTKENAENILKCWDDINGMIHGSDARNDFRAKKPLVRAVVDGKNIRHQGASVPATSYYFDACASEYVIEPTIVRVDIDGKPFEINVDKAKELGLLAPVS